jgi:uncharacterized protein HemY
LVFTDPLQWVVIGVLIILFAWVIVYVLLRVLRTLSKVDGYIDRKEQERKQLAPS